MTFPATKHIRYLLAAYLFLATWPLSAQESIDLEEKAVRRAAAEFVDAFNDLDWERFTASFAEDATVFFPRSSHGHRVDGRSAAVAAFKSMFEDFPDQNPGPPYLMIEPLDLEVQVYGETAIVTFHLDGPEVVNRRTIVFAKRDDRWKIAHLHASRISI